MEKDIRQVKGRIFDIQKYSIHDGPGIRTIIFLKGCFLRCKWCCNPESQEYKIQQMEVNGKLETIGRDITVEKIMEYIIKDMPYYRKSGGGVTLSGGEALYQPEFATALLKACKEYGIHTAIESTGMSDYNIIEQYLPYVDLFLMDIKHVDNKKHKEFTGKPNDLILENSKKIAESGVDLIIRVPVVEGFNHTKEEIKNIANFAATLYGVKELHLLPYHRLGVDKYRGLGREYSLSHIEPLSNEYMEELLEVAKSSGLKCQIGG